MIYTGKKNPVALNVKKSCLNNDLSHANLKLATATHCLNPQEYDSFLNLTS